MLQKNWTGLREQKGLDFGYCKIDSCMADDAGLRNENYHSTFFFSLKALISYIGTTHIFINVNEEKLIISHHC